MASSVPTHDYVWEQGDDLILSFIYKEGADVGSATPVNLLSYSLRMDIGDGTNRIYSLNSDDLTDPADVIDEATLGADGTISILVNRSLTLAGGPINTAMAAGKSVFFYDIFLRDGSDKQHKILSGTITVNKSVTQWLA